MMKKVVKHTVRCLKWLGIGIVVLAALLTAYFYIGGIEWGDWTISDEAELRLEKRDVPDEDNAYIALMSLTNLYHVADNDQENEKSGDDSAKVVSDKDFVKYYGNLLNSEGWEDWAAVRSDPASPKRAEKILADNAQFFDAFRAALSLKGFAVADKRSEEAKRKKEGKGPWVCYLHLYKPFVAFAQLVALRVQVALERGDVETAASSIGEIHVLGQLLKVNNEELSGCLAGAIIENISFMKMCDVVAMGKATDEVVERFSKMVAVSEANAQMSWKRALMTEIARHVEGVEWICSHSFNDLIKALFPERLYKDGNFSSPLCRILSNWPGFSKFAFHRREMLYRQAMLGRAVLAGDDNLTEMIQREIPRNPFLPNFAGNIFTDYFGPSFSSIAKGIRLDCIRPILVLAAEKWRRAHGGEDPPTLEALVPDYLAAVPADPWDKTGAPLKYDASTGVAWSVGNDGKYDYREVAKKLAAAGNTASVDDNTQKYAFRLDGKPINNEGTPECDVEPEELPKEGNHSRHKQPPVDAKPRHWQVPIASCRAAVKGRYDSRVFITGVEQGLTEGEVISPSAGKCGYRVLSISDRCVWFEAFYGDEPPNDKLQHGVWPDFSRIDTLPPTPPPGSLMFGKRKFWPGDAIMLRNSGAYLMVDDFLEGKAVVFRLLDTGMRPVRDLLCVIVREEK